MMLSIGMFSFSLATAAYQDMQRQMSWRHATSERVGARSASQYIGPGDETITLSGIIAPPITGRARSLDTLRSMADEGRSLPLVDGAGNVYGRYIIASINETRALFFADGTPRRIEFQIALNRVDD